MNGQSLLSYLEGEQRAPGLLRPLTPLLGGAGTIYGTVQALRAACYQKSLFKSYKAPCPVISIGNITSGGTGKTPFTLWLARTLLAEGRRVAVVSRGYRQASNSQVTVVSTPDGIRTRPPLAADEAYLIARRLPGVTVITGPQRNLTIGAAVEDFGCDIVLMDDAFQHLKVQRDLDIVLLDATLPWSNGKLLPGGLLREFPQALRRADILVLTRSETASITESNRQYITKNIVDKPIFTAKFTPQSWHPNPLPEGAALAFCGIARPETFRRTLENEPLTINKFIPFADHHPFTHEQISDLESAAKDCGAKYLVCTEKDAVKIDRERLTMPLYYPIMEMDLGEDGAKIHAQALKAGA